MKNIFVKLALCAGILVLLCSQFTLLVQNVRLKNNMNRDRELNSQVNVHCIQTISDMVENSGLFTDKSLLSVFDSIQSDAVLVCRVSEYHCGECVDYAIGKMAESISKEGIELPMLLLGEYRSHSSLKILLSRIGVKEHVYCRILEHTGLPIDSHGAPHYFVLYRNGTADNFFTPERNDRELTDLYFCKLKDRWNGQFQM